MSEPTEMLTTKLNSDKGKDVNLKSCWRHEWWKDTHFYCIFVEQFLFSDKSYLILVLFHSLNMCHIVLIRWDLGQNQYRKTFQFHKKVIYSFHRERHLLHQQGVLVYRFKTAWLTFVWASEYLFYLFIYLKSFIWDAPKQQAADSKSASWNRTIEGRMNQVIMGSLYFLYNAASFHVSTVTQTDRDEKQLMCVVIMRQLSYESRQN